MAEFLLNVIQLEIMARSWISEDHLGLDASAAVVGDAAITAHLWGNSEGSSELLIFFLPFRDYREWVDPKRIYFKRYMSLQQMYFLVR